MFGMFSDDKKKEVLEPPANIDGAQGSSYAQAAKELDKKKEPAIAGEKCPKCGAILIVRKNGGTGALFVGCSAFPKCRFTANIDIGGDAGTGKRGFVKLGNGITVYFAESLEALRIFKGMKQKDTGIVKTKGDRVYRYVYTLDGWAMLVPQKEMDDEGCQGDCDECEGQWCEDGNDED